MKKLIEAFNHPDTYLIISDYPEKTKRGEKNYGIAWHTKAIIDPIAQKHNVKFVVLAEKGYTARPQIEGDNILILRVFDQKHPTLFPRILKWLFVFHKIKRVHVHSEFCANGGIKNLMLLLPFLMIIKLTGKHITYFTHNVVTNLDSFAPHLNLKQGSLKVRILNMTMKLYYRMLGIIVNQFVVMDEVIKKRLSTFTNAAKIFVSPFWVTKQNYPLNQEQAKKKLGVSANKLLLLSFGFITYYKGADWLIETVQKLRKQKANKDIHLILAGGPAYSLKDKPYYQRYFHQITESLKNEKNIQITGFVPEDEIGKYFTAADAVILPYRGLIGASGSLTHTLSYSKPFLISESMYETLDTEKVKKYCTAVGIQPRDKTFSHTTKSLAAAIKRLRSPEFRAKLITVAKNIAEERSFDRLLNRCYNELYNTQAYARRAAHKTQLLSQSAS